MQKYRHTVNLAFALNIVVFDDHGHKVDAFIFPFALLVIGLPSLAYTLLRSALFAFTHHASRFTFHALARLSALAPGGWRDDLRFMSLALLTLFSLSLGERAGERAGVRAGVRAL